jgi:transcriptional regulator with XRE-family HTH domain
MNRIKELRKQKKMTQKNLAKHLQIADSTLSYWEMGKYEPDSESLKKLSRFFHVSIDYILGGDFSQWRTTSVGTLYADFDKPYSDDAAASVSDTIIAYNENPAEGDPARLTSDSIQLSAFGDLPTPDAAKTMVLNTPDNNLNTQTGFIRSEFEGLTQEEIDKLAEYAEFIKSRRTTNKTKS